MKKILLINYNGHPGISAIGDAYRKAFEKMGLSFDYLSMQSPFGLHADEKNMIVKSVLSTASAEIIIFIQPTYLYAETCQYLKSIRKNKKYYSIQTEDPYSLSGILEMNELFDLKFTNEKNCAINFKDNGFRYLPVAFDSLQPYRVSHTKEHDVTLLCSYYDNRMDYLHNMRQLGVKKYIGGSFALAMKSNSQPILDISQFTVAQGLLPRHKEYEIFHTSKFVLNPHRNPSLVGKSNYICVDKDCQEVMSEAVSPNPRFFESAGLGSIPLNDSSRTECFEILEKYLGKTDKSGFEYNFTLPSPENIKDLEDRLKNWQPYSVAAEKLRLNFWNNETYFARAKQLLEEIS